MLSICLSFLWFSMAVALHLFWCRMEKTKRLQVAAFFVAAALCLSGYFYSSQYFWGRLPSEVLFSPVGLTLNLTALVMYVLFIPIYLIFYYSVAIDSVSRSAMALIRAQEGIPYEEILSVMTDEKFLVPRINALVDTGYAHFDGKKYRLSAKAKLTCRVLAVYQALCGRDMGG